MTQPEAIQSDDRLSRWLFFPSMFDHARELVWKRVFQFQEKYGRRESLVWRKDAPDIADVHRLGCQKETDALAHPERSDRKYKGAVTAFARDIISYQNQNRHGLTLMHVPEEGIWHAEVRCNINPNNPFSKPDRIDLIAHLEKVFGEMEAYSCPD